MSRSTPVKSKPDNRLVRYLKDSRAEIAKVTWPTREEGIRLTIIVSVVTLISGIALFFIDSVFGWIIGQIVTL